MSRIIVRSETFQTTLVYITREFQAVANKTMKKSRLSNVLFYLLFIFVFNFKCGSYVRFVSSGDDGIRMSLIMSCQVFWVTLGLLL